MKRYYRVRDEIADHESGKLGNFAMNDILHQLHCHFNHCYDIGHRLTEERRKLNEIAPKNEEYDEEKEEDLDDDDDNDNDIDDSMDGIIIRKRSKHYIPY